jgi:hypothetical protein
MSAYLTHSLIQAIQVLCVDDVRLDCRYVLPNTNSSDGLIQSPLSPGHYEDVGTLIDKALCRSQSDTTGSSSNDRYLSFELWPLSLSIKNLLLEMSTLGAKVCFVLPSLEKCGITLAPSSP